LADGLVAYWNMDGDATEPVNTLDGTAQGDTTFNASGIVIGSTNHAAFDGTGDYIEVANDAELNLTTAISVSGWIDVDTSAAQQGTIVSKWDDLGVNQRGYLLALHTDDTPRFYISHTGADFPSAVGVALTDGWHHLVGTYDNLTGDIKLYVDGTLVATTNSPGTIFSNSESLLIGANDGFGGVNRKFTTGSVDEVRIYNKALSDTEVTRLNNYGSFTLDVTPDTDTNPLGTDHEVTITLDTPLSYIPVLYEVSGNVAPGAGTQYIYTDENGQIVFTYTGVNPGTDTIIACMDVSWFFTGGGVCNVPFPEPSDTATKTWEDTFEISGMKYRDLDFDGENDGEPGLENWVIFIDGAGPDDGVLDNSVTDGVCDGNALEPCDTTDVNGEYSFDGLASDTYDVCEVNQSNWVQTEPFNPNCYEVTVGPDAIDVDFGNVHLIATNGRTKGFWTNKNGAAMFDDVTDLPAMVALNLRNADGSGFNPISYNQFKTWLNKANGKNMAYMLSAQLAATELDVLNVFITGDPTIYAPSLLPFIADIPGLSNLGFISVSDLMTAADVALGLDGVVNEGDSNWAYFNALKNVLDAVNSQAVIQVDP
jgi:hypothetical protein